MDAFPHGENSKEESKASDIISKACTITNKAVNNREKGEDWARAWDDAIDIAGVDEDGEALV